jgi:hypothetical protein
VANEIHSRRSPKNQPGGRGGRKNGHWLVVEVFDSPKMRTHLRSLLSRKAVVIASLEGPSKRRGKGEEKRW